jgi:GWxTD domain-containing protein
MRIPARIILLIASLLLVLSPAAGAQLARGSGDFELFLDMTSLPLENGYVLELFQIAIPVQEIRYEEKDGSYLADVRVALTLMRGEEKIHEKGLEIRDSRDSRPEINDLSGFIYMSDSSTVEPGSYTLTVRVEDLNRRKKTLMGLIKGKYLYSEIKDLGIDIPGFPSGRIALSDPVLLWSRESGGRFVTNPMQIYGLKNDTLSFFASALVPEKQVLDIDSIEVFMSVIDSKGEMVGSKSGTVPVNGRRTLVFGSFDVNTWPAGSYMIRVDVFSGGALKVSSAKDFSVAWELLNWQKPRRDVLVEARLLFRDSEYDKFSRMSIGEQERVLTAYWKKIDPTPHTAVNELYDVFQSRVRYADSHFGGSYARGALSDRGQLYIMLGPPDEIIQESVPFNREDLNETLGKLEDKYKVVIHSTQKGPGTDYAMMKATTSNVGRPYRGGGTDTGAYELWMYSMRGDPLLESDRIMMSGSGMRYLFVDKDGIGRYILVGTSEEHEGFGVGSGEE